MVERKQFLHPIESILPSSEYLLLKKFLGEQGVHVVPGQLVEDVSHGGGRVGVVYHIDKYAAKVARSNREVADIHREKKIYEKLDGIQNIVRVRFAPENTRFLILDFIDAEHPEDFFRTKSINSPEARKQRLIVLQRLLETLLTAMKKGIFINDIDLASNSFIHEKDQGQLEITIIDVGDAIDAQEIVEKVNDQIDFIKRSKEREQEYHDQSGSNLEKSKQQIIQEVARIPETVSNPQNVRDELRKLSDDELMSSLLLSFQQREKAIKKPVQEEQKGLKGLLRELWEGPVVASPPQYYMTGALMSKVRNFNEVKKALDSSQSKLSQYEELIQACQDLLSKISSQPERLVSHLQEFSSRFKDMKNDSEVSYSERIYLQGLSEFLTRLSMNEISRLHSFAKYLAEMSVELIAKEFGTDQTNVKEIVNVLHEKFGINLSTQEILQRGIAGEIKDPSIMAGKVIMCFSHSLVEEYTQSIPDSAFFQETPAYGESREQRIKRYKTAVKFFYQRYETTSTVEQERELARSTLSILSGINPLPTKARNIAPKLTDLGMWFVSTEEIIWDLDSLLTSSWKIEAGQINRSMRQLFTSIQISGVPESAETYGGHMYFSYDTQEARDQR